MTGGSLEELVAGVEQAVAGAKKHVQAAEAAAAHWQEQYQQEKELRLRLQEEQEEQEQQAAAAAAAAAAQPQSPGKFWSAPGGGSGSPRAPGTGRRHTAPALAPMPDMLDRLSGTASRLEDLRRDLERDLVSGRAPDGSLAMSRLSSMLHACSFLREASAAACGGGGGGSCDGEPAGGGGSSSDPFACRVRRGNERGAELRCREGEEGQEVALHDDGAAGVGATAAAAVSVALAQSWAAAAGSRPAPHRRAAAAEGAVRPGKARFKLVAAVPRGSRKQQGREHKSSSASASRTHLAGGSGSGNGSDTGSGGMPHSPSAAAAVGHSPLGESPTGSGSSPLHKGHPPFDSTNGLDTLAEADAHSMDDAQEATWRASGQHLKLQWMSAPCTVLVVYKPVPAVLQACVAAVAWLARHGCTVFVEPGVHDELAAAVQQYIDNGSSTGAAGDPLTGSALSSFNGSLDSGDGWAPLGLPPRPAPPGKAAAAGGGGNGGGGSGGTLTEQAVDLSRQLLTWEEGPCGCPPAVPCSVGHQLDLAITLGGDGTVLWTCGLFAAGAVPPLVPFAMGSLGFMTPFEIRHMGEVLSRVTGTDRGLPLMLRHRLQCRIIRGTEAGSTPDLVAACQEEYVVLNEVVIDRGMKAQLCNLQCYADQNHVTLVQGDGLIVATPTGSTAYNLAAGGAMVHPAVPCFLFTPICPHSLASRPLVLPEHVTLRVKVPLDSRSSAFCSFDGRARQELCPGDSVMIAMSRWPVPMVCNLDASHDWFLSMRDGLSWNVRKKQAGAGQ